MSDFGFESTADDVLAGKDLSGRTAFITGGYSGLGQETARAMAAKGAHIIIAGRDLSKAEDAAKAIRDEVPNAQIDTIRCDLASLESVRACGTEARKRFSKIDLLINNAGVMACPYGETAEGFEMQFGTNHLGHFLLTKELMPLVEQGDHPRIVNLSSRGHHFAPVDLDDPNFDHREYDKWQSYGQSKTANILFSVGLEDRFADKGVHAIALHPGGIMTNLGRHMTEEDMAWMMKRIEENAKESGEKPQGFKTIPQGAATTCWAATAVALEGTGGVYCEDCHVAELDDDDPTGGVRSYALDKDNADRLWSLSEKLVGEAFTA
uniref:SDR family NAD(P)-dependent oxidoreductase n=1 Tax=Parerythrobacter lutipelagi TaxID=1964208 RepID=UPI0010F69A70|nr:SDR family NAD(P)-dependent oxidoreductase [Parerythrobacter lutipelagi]